MAEDNRTAEAENEPSPEPSRPSGPTEEEVVRGRAAGTPFVLLGGVALAIWTVVGLVTLALLLLWWLD